MRGLLPVWWDILVGEILKKSGCRCRMMSDDMIKVSSYLSLYYRSNVVIL